MIGYVLKMYPRFSETFILSEILELERRGRDIDVVSFRKPDDGKFHEDLARVRARVRYLPEAWHHAPRTYFAEHLAAFARAPRAWVRSAAIAATHGAEARAGFLRAPLLARHAREAGWTRMHAHFANQPAVAAMFAAGLTGIPFTLTAHAKDLFHRAVSRRLLVRLLRSAERIVTVSEYNRRWLENLDRAVPSRVVRIYNGIDLGRFSTIEATTAAEPPLVLAVGRLVEKKGFDVLIDACAHLLARGSRFRCEIVGKGPLERALRDRIRERRLDGRVALVGPLSRDAVAERLRAAAVFAVPCVIGADGNRDGLPTVLIEAAASGVPAVATEVTGIPEAVVDDLTGRVVSPGDPAVLAAALHELLIDPERRRRMGRRARGLAERRFDLRANVAELDALFAGPPVASGSPSGSRALEEAAS